MTMQEFFDKFAEMEHESVVASAQGNEELARELFCRALEFQENCFPGVKRKKEFKIPR